MHDGLMSYRVTKLAIMLCACQELCAVSKSNRCWKEAVDMEGTALKEGQMVAKATRIGNSAVIERRWIKKINGQLIYLDGDKARPVDPCKLLVIGGA